MKLLTHNMLTSSIIKGVTKGFSTGNTGHRKTFIKQVQNGNVNSIIDDGCTPVLTPGASIDQAETITENVLSLLQTLIDGRRITKRQLNIHIYEASCSSIYGETSPTEIKLLSEDKQVGHPFLGHPIDAS